MRAGCGRTWRGPGGAVLDEPATAQALSASFLRALDCGALDPDEVCDATGLGEEDLRALAHRVGTLATVRRTVAAQPH